MSVDSGRNIILCGFMGSGKTTLGKLLARRLGMEFVDMDDVIVRNEGMCVPEIFAQRGEAGFRDAEHKAAVQLAASRGLVLATGGGALTFARNAEALRRSGTVVFLNPGFEVCYTRIRKTDRPLVQGNTKSQLRQLYRVRTEQYRRAAHLEVRVRGNKSSCVEEVVVALGRL